jgi:hypothetical protein
VFQLVFDMRYAATGGFRRKANNHPSGNANGKRGTRYDEKETSNAVSMSTLSEGIAQLVGSLQAQAEGSANHAGDGADDERNDGQPQGIAASLRGIEQKIWLTFHSE